MSVSNGHIIMGYPCIGKTSISGDGWYVDLESSNFRDQFGNKIPNWELVCANIAKDLSAQGYNVFISSHKSMQDILKKCENLIVVFPAVDLKEKWVDRASQRWREYGGDKNAFALNRIVSHYMQDIEDLKKYCEDNNVKYIELGTTDYDLRKVLYDFFLEESNND